ncbi:hypothetical protein NBRC10513_007412 [Rhodotorula toruloides]|uniref:BY PROTMAP: gi/472581962/gb/EMS19670.1/ MFS monocarboxylate transporter [Rhodosporidium toruloides NP11] gi/647395009/emb/CDR36245.1/ RHTO0S01e17414g1_1 [Rhodosporidium toruloides] n=1 Tax=Rhodotorula toruloides TaxID=5286 RepID=A0A0K3CCN7_RHOTO|nr:Major facilitator superfamily domain-containing protein [Rhodotorula toruloides]
MSVSPVSTHVAVEDVEKGGNDVEDVKGDGEAGVPEVAKVDEEKPLAPPSFPDGGRRAYMTTLGGVLVLFCTFGTSNTYASFQDEWQRNQLKDYTPSSIAWIGSAHLFILFIMGLPSGRLFDAGYFRYQLPIGSLLWCFGIFMLSLSTEYYQLFLSFSVCLGMALGLVFSPTLSCVASYFSPKKRTAFMGSVAAGAALGAVVFPIITNHVFPRRGFPFGIRILAYIHVALLLLANILMRPRNDIPPRKPPPALPLISSFLKQPATWCACLGCAFVMLGMFIPIFYVQVFVQDHGASPTVVTYALPILNASACLSRISIGFAADKFGNLTVAVPVTTLIGGMIFAMLGATSTGGAVAFCVVFGAASGAWVTIMAPSLISLSASVREFGVRAGLGFQFVALASLIGSPVAGAILGATPRTASGEANYLGVCVFGGCATLVGAGLLAVARGCQVRSKGTQWV